MGREVLTCTLSTLDGEGLAWLYREAEVLARVEAEEGITLTLRAGLESVERIKRRFAGVL